MGIPCVETGRHPEIAQELFGESCIEEKGNHLWIHDIVNEHGLKMGS